MAAPMPSGGEDVQRNSSSPARRGETTSGNRFPPRWPPPALESSRRPRRRCANGEVMKRLRFVLVGGFLGAGKTTAVARLARHYAARGLRVGLVTNDQADDLVDTNSLRSQGFPV